MDPKWIIPLSIALVLSFTAGWMTNEWQHTEERQRLMETQAATMRLAAESAGVAERALRYASSYQETLNECMGKIGLTPVQLEKGAKP